VAVAPIPDAVISADGANTQPPQEQVA
jgi:hypothetical protein